MNDNNKHDKLMSEKEAGTRLGIARITLLRGRQKGRIRFFRIGTRVLYCEEQLTEFLKSCEQNGHKENNGEESEADPYVARRKDNRVSASPRTPPHKRESVNSRAGSSKTDLASLPFSAPR